MHKQMPNPIIDIILGLVLLVSLCGILTLAVSALWLNTYKIFTDKTIVAEVEVSPLREKNGEKEFDVTIRPVKSQNALFGNARKESDDLEYEQEQKYTLNGDEFRIGGQIIKFQDLAALLGFRTIFKVTRLEGAYLDVDDQGGKELSVYELNGGVDSIFKFVQANEPSFSFIIDTAMGDYPGKNVQNTSIKYGLFVTEEGFLLDRL